MVMTRRISSVLRRDRGSPKLKMSNHQLKEGLMGKWDTTGVSAAPRNPAGQAGTVGGYPSLTGWRNGLISGWVTHQRAGDSVSGK
jgi:hypothetical protein